MLNKVIERKKQNTISLEQKKEKRNEIKENFREFIFSNAQELHEIFPSVVIGEGISSNILGLTYSPSRIAGFKHHTISNDTYNICLDSISLSFNVGYGANTSKGKQFKFDMNTTKSQQRKLFKQILEYLVSVSYWTGYKKDRVHQVWKGHTQLI